MMFSKDAMQEELSNFIGPYINCVGGLLDIEFDGDPKKVTLFKNCSIYYDYAFLGEYSNHPYYCFRESGVLGHKCVEGSLSDIELFLIGLKNQHYSMSLLFGEYDTDIPHLAIKTIEAAIARHVLYGGERFYISEDGVPSSGYLSFREIGLLADMDEKSVRNAANPKNKDALKTTIFGKRTFIYTKDAYKWLVNRRGFVPTKGVTFKLNND